MQYLDITTGINYESIWNDTMKEAKEWQHEYTSTVLKSGKYFRHPQSIVVNDNIVVRRTDEEPRNKRPKLILDKDKKLAENYHTKNKSSYSYSLPIEEPLKANRK